MQAEAAADPPAGIPCITLSHNLASTADVDRVMAEAGAAGARIVAAPKTQPWGGYTGYFADPDGFRWEVAFNPDLGGRRRRQSHALTGTSRPCLDGSPRQGGVPLEQAPHRLDEFR